MAGNTARKRDDFDHGAPLAVFKAVADPTRLALLTLMLREQRCVGALAAQLGVSTAAVSQHLRLLRQAGLVTAERRGRHLHYAVRRETLQEAGEWLHALSRTAAAPHGPCGGGCSCHLPHLPKEEKEP